MRNWKLVVALGTSAWLLGGCSSREEPARQAVSMAEGRLNEVRDEAARYAPEQLTSADAHLAALKGDLEARDYKGVLAGTPGLNEEVVALQDAVIAGRTQAAAAMREWQELSEEVPSLVEAIEKRVNGLSGKRLPRDVQPESFEAAKASLHEMKSLWAEAMQAFDAGNATEAADKARSVQSKARKAREQLGMSPA